MPLSVKVGARDSPLSIAQVEEVLKEIQRHGSIQFETVFIPSWGDLDLVTPLTAVGKTDFFTQTIDALVQEGRVDIAIHSAKDLPEVMPDMLEVIALTEGVEASDSFVSMHYTLASLPLGARIGVSCARRIEAVKKLRADLIPKSIRGTVNHRIALLKQGEYEGLILAEAGLIRLHLTLPREKLDIPVHPLQGRLAIVARKDNQVMKAIFACLDTRLCG